jgi:hypothetical protein
MRKKHHQSKRTKDRAELRKIEKDTKKMKKSLEQLKA